MKGSTLGFWILLLTWSWLLCPVVAGGEPSSKSKAGSDAESGVTVYYFFGNYRCKTCKAIEALSKETVFESFSGELEAGNLQWKPVNTDEPENKHFLKDYNLYTRSLVLVKRVDGEQTKWKNCDKVWNLVHSPVEFKAYVEAEIRGFLEPGS